MIEDVQPKVQVPSDVTLKKYGLSSEEWLDMLAEQGGVCGVCGRVPATGRLVTDHEHVAGWKKMPPEQRKMYVRGLVCWFDNHSYLGRGITVAKAEGVVAYLKRYQARRP